MSTTVKNTVGLQYRYKDYKVCNAAGVNPYLSCYYVTRHFDNKFHDTYIFISFLRVSV